MDKFSGPKGDHYRGLLLYTVQNVKIISSLFRLYNMQPIYNICLEIKLTTDEKNIAPPLFLFKKNLNLNNKINKRWTSFMIILLQPPAILSLKVFGRI